jgi:hypothetical protein
VASCFVIMPFRPELNYLYRSLKDHIKQAFPDVSVERGDDRVLTKPILEKIANFIREADVVVADCSGRNPNVFYELGMAHALEKPVVLITSDPIEEAPTDIRAFEFISYAALKPETFLAKLENALQTVIGNPYAEVHPEAIGLFQEFTAATNLDLAPADKDDFVAAATALRASGQHLPAAKGRARTEFVIRRLLGVEPQIDILVALKSWLDQKYQVPP